MAYLGHQAGQAGLHVAQRGQHAAAGRAMGAIDGAEIALGHAAGSGAQFRGLGAQSAGQAAGDPVGQPRCSDNGHQAQGGEHGQVDLVIVGGVFLIGLGLCA